MVFFAEYGAPMTGAPYEMNFADGKRRTGRCDEKYSMVTGSSTHGCNLDVSWDLYSNRVVPYWIMDIDSNGRWPRPISHAWMDEKDRTAMWTPINAYNWPVPIQKMPTST